MVLTFTTDFGLRDGYVGIMKGVALGIQPGLQMIDISHSVEPGDVRAGAWVIANSYRWFPKGSVHLVVVDPGVGSQRRAVVVAKNGHLFVCPDNGLLTRVLDDDKDDDHGLAYEISATELFLPVVSFTFHGRDVFAPIGAFLAQGGPASKVGEQIEVTSLQRLHCPKPIVQAHEIVGSIAYIDHFGNLITDIGSTQLFDAEAVVIGERTIALGNTYSSALPNGLIAIAGSHGYLEVGVNGGRADQQLGARPGDRVTVKRARGTVVLS